MFGLELPSVTFGSGTALLPILKSAPPETCGVTRASSRIVRFIISVLLVGSTFLLPVARAQTVSPISGISGSPTGVAYDSGKREIFVTAQNTSYVYIFSDSTKKQVATVQVGGPAQGQGL